MVTFQDLLVALRMLDTERPTLELVQWLNSDPASYRDLVPLVDAVIPAQFPLPEPPAPPRRPPSSIETSESLSARVRRALARKLVPRLPPPPPPPPDETLRASGMDCSFSVLIDSRRDVSVPLLTWIYDLQHHHLPDLLSPRERRQRDETIQREAARATRLVVKSASTAQDLQKFLPQFQDKVRVLQWVSHIPTEAYAQEPNYVLARYHLPDKFFYLPNQFWAHKNHALVIKALKLLHAKGVKPVVVCTGDTNDHRNPEMLATLFRDLSMLNLRGQFLILGSVPRADVFALMRQSIAVLNPSLFEGFGLSASEAKSLGKRTLLADLPPLREQEPPSALFFRPDDAQDLAAKMELLWSTVSAGPDLEMEAQAKNILPERQRAFGRAFVEIAREAIAASR